MFNFAWLNFKRVTEHKYHVYFVITERQTSNSDIVGEETWYKNHLLQHTEKGIEP